jgi:hypothetical protein
VVIVYLFFFICYGLFCDYIVSNGGMMDGWWIRKNLEGNGRGQMRYSLGIFLEALKRTTRNLRIAGIRESNRACPEHEYGAWQLCRPVRFPTESADGNRTFRFCSLELRYRPVFGAPASKLVARPAVVLPQFKERGNSSCIQTPSDKNPVAQIFTPPRLLTPL